VNPSGSFPEAAPLHKPPLVSCFQELPEHAAAAYREASSHVLFLRIKRFPALSVKGGNER
jgi:hypothetical protein